MNVRKRWLLVAVAVGLLAAGCQSPPDRQAAGHNLGEYADDATITAKVKGALVNDPQLKAADINVETYKGVVQLSGFVGSREAELRAAEVARGVPGVKAVNNDMQLKLK